MKNPNRFFFIAGVAAIFAVVIAAYFLTLRQENIMPAPMAAAVAPAVPSALASLRITGSEGAAFVRDSEGRWQNAASGALISPGVDLRTGASGRLSLAYGNSNVPDVHLTVSADSLLRLDKSESGLARFVLAEGLTVAEVNAGERNVQFVNSRGDASAETRDGTLYLLTDKEGTLSAAVTRGQASVRGAGQVVVLQSGYSTVVAPGAAPQKPSEIPRTLWLKVQWPNDSSTAARRQLVTGTTAPGARVVVGKKTITASVTGEFKSEVDLREGENRIQVYVVDVLGRKQEEKSPPIELDTKAPETSIETSPDMWRRRDLKGD